MKYAIDADGKKKPYKLESRDGDKIIVMGEYDSVEDAQYDLKVKLGLPKARKSKG